ncbi:MAG: divalent-cation tolerance protein CutA [Methanocellales archaeon]
MFSIVYITASNFEEAKRIARILVEERLAACANFFPITSSFQWKGVQEASEVAVIAKTKFEKVEEIIERVKQIHSYEIPCIISWKIEQGYKPFLKWIEDEVRK